MSRESEASRLGVEITVTEAGFLIRCAGEISREGIERATKMLVGHPDFDPTSPTLWDFREAVSPGLTADEMRLLGVRNKELRGPVGPSRIAVVTGRDSEFGGARMYGGMHASSLEGTYRVFRDLEAAERWAFAGEDE